MGQASYYERDLPDGVAGVSQTCGGKHLPDNLCGAGSRICGSWGASLANETQAPHFLHEMVLEAKPSHLNPNTGRTWMDEDWVKRVMKVKKGVHRRTATESCLRRYLLGLPGKMLEAVSSL